MTESWDDERDDELVEALRGEAVVPAPDALVEAVLDLAAAAAEREPARARVSAAART